MRKTLRGSYEVMCEKWVALFFMLPGERKKASPKSQVFRVVFNEEE